MAALHYDAVVIGAGNGGLSAALTLANAGKKVLLAEKHNLPGGFATSFIRGRFEFEASLHELCDFGTPGNSGNLYALFEELGVLDKLEFVTVPEAFRTITLKTGEDYTMPFGVKEFTDKMESYVPGSRESVETFFALADETRRAMAYLTQMRGNPDTAVLKSEYPNFMRTAAYSVEQVLNAIKMPRKAQDILNVYWSYLGAPEDQLGFLHYALMVNLYITLGAQIPKTRSHGISCALADTLYWRRAERYGTTARRSTSSPGTARWPACALPTARKLRPLMLSATLLPTRSMAPWWTRTVYHLRSCGWPMPVLWRVGACPCSLD